MTEEETNRRRGPAMSMAGGHASWVLKTNEMVVKVVLKCARVNSLVDHLERSYRAYRDRIEPADVREQVHVPTHQSTSQAASRSMQVTRKEEQVFAAANAIQCRSAYTEHTKRPKGYDRNEDVMIVSVQLAEC